MAIIKLDQKTIDQIAAGEVIESPVSVVKELVENSIDAGAKNITVEIKNGGKTYIRVTDDGRGIEAADMNLAFEKHATSKIKSFDDLYDIYSLGFRGEALASIVSVADITAISKTADELAGKKISFNNSKPVETKVASNTGTSIEVRDLFKNLPARHKFLKSDITETNQVSKLMYSLALGYEDIGFKYIKDDRLEFKTTANEALDLRITKLLDDNLNGKLIEVKANNATYSIRGFISDPNYYRGSRSLEYLYVNNRLIDSRLITDTIEREYRSFIPQGRFPAFFIFISTNPKNLDVNVHPNKRRIKFNYEDELISLLEQSIYEALSKNKNPDRVGFNEEKEKIADLSDYSKLLEAYTGVSVVKEDKPSYEDKSFFDNNIDLASPAKEAEVSDESYKLSKSPINESYINYSPTYSYLTSVFGRYSIFKKSKDEILIMDHRRADEAVRFDAFIKDLKANDNIHSQMLLEPLIINLKANDYDSFMVKKDEINKLGFDIEDFGEGRIIIRSVPQIFENPENDDFIYELIDLDFTDKTDIFYKNLYKFIKSTSFRKGHRVGKDEAVKLMADIMKLTNPYKTYDGKNILLIVDEATLEKYFER